MVGVREPQVSVVRMRKKDVEDIGIYLQFKVYIHRIVVGLQEGSVVGREGVRYVEI